MASDPQSQQDGETLSEVNVIPLADLSLVLLIILMILSPMIMQSMIKVQNSRAAASKTLHKPEPPLILSIKPNSVELNTVKLSDLELATKLQTELANREDKLVMLTADPSVIHGRVVQILDLVKQQGADKIALLHSRSEAPAMAAKKK